jgi:hypothetical protein
MDMVIKIMSINWQNIFDISSLIVEVQEKYFFFLYPVTISEQSLLHMNIKDLKGHKGFELPIVLSEKVN